MKERPILFNVEMVRALLDGRKTMTRRVAKLNAAGRVQLPGSPHNWHCEDPDAWLACPYGQPGDRLWVKERHSFNDIMKSATPHCWLVDVEYSDGTERNILAETKKPKLTRERGEIGWRPSIHMPRWSSRILLEITNVRVEHVQEISEEDALNEGITYHDLPNNGLDPMRARTWFRGLWETINAARGFGWDVNPWVWVVEFRIVEG